MIAFACRQMKVLQCSYGLRALRDVKAVSLYRYKSHISHKYRITGSSYPGGRLLAYNRILLLSKEHDAIVHTIIAPHSLSLFLPLYNYNVVRCFRLNDRLYENPSSKVEVTVQSMKNKQKEKVEEIIKEAVSSAAATGATPGSPTDNAKVADASKAAVVKKPLKARIWEEVLHYYHGFRLLFIDINICRKLLWRVLNGNTLTRRENKLLVRTTSDLFRLIPFSVFIIVPFMELLLPVFIKFFPGMLPSTFQTAKEREDKLKQSLQVKLEMAKFLQKTLDEMAVQHKKEHKSEEAKQFAEFFEKIKDPNKYVASEEIIKYAKRFEDEITLDSLSRVQLAALCRLLELNTMGTTNFLRFQLRVKLRSLAADDRDISREGVDALDLFELQQACKARGMRAYGLTSERLRSQLQEWIELSLNEKVPPTLLLLSRAMLISDDKTTTTKLKETIRVLPDSVAAHTKAAIGESEGKIDNKTKIEIIKEEERKIKEEHEEEREVEKAKAHVKEESVLLSKEPTLERTTVPPAVDPYAQTIVTPVKATELAADMKKDHEKSISSKDAELLKTALKTLSSDSKMMVERETIKEIKEELEDYKEDVEELREVRNVVQEPVHESRAAKLLYKKVNNMIGQLDEVLGDLEKKHEEFRASQGEKQDVSPEAQALKKKEDEFIRIDELVNVLKKIKQTSDVSRLKAIETVLSILDQDKDGVITVNEVSKVAEAISRDNVRLTEIQLLELISLLEREHVIEAEEKIEKAIAKSMKEAKKIEDAQKKVEITAAIDAAIDAATAAAKTAQEVREVASSMPDLVNPVDIAPEIRENSNEDFKDLAPEIKDKATDLNLVDEKNHLKTEMSKTPNTDALLEAAEKQKEKMIPKATTIATTLPPTIPPAVPGKSDDKRV